MKGIFFPKSSTPLMVFVVKSSMDLIPVLEEKASLTMSRTKTRVIMVRMRSENVLLMPLTVTLSTGLSNVVLYLFRQDVLLLSVFWYLMNVLLIISKSGSVVIILFMNTVKMSAREIPKVIITGLKAIPRNQETLIPFSFRVFVIRSMPFMLSLPIPRQNNNTNIGESTMNIHR